ncbi:MAG: glycogen debranching enzyme, partial [Anaerolineales bacterium]
MMSQPLPGQSYPLGATCTPDGVNFCIFSKNCDAVELHLFDDVDDGAPSRVIKLDPERNRTFYYWHVLLPDIEPGQLYGYRVAGCHDPARGFRFDGQKLLLDPYARAIAAGQRYDRQAAKHPGDNAAHAMKSVVVSDDDYDWEGDAPIRLPYARTVIYEMHVRGFTQHP